MKKICLVLFISFFAFIAKAQFVVGLYQSSNKPAKITTSQNLSVTNNGNSQVLPANTRLKITGKVGNTYSLRNLLTSESYSTSSDALDQQLVNETQKVTAIAGILTFPFKYRPQKDITETSFSLSGAGGINIALGKTNIHSLSILFAVGPSTISLNQDNTDTSAHITAATSRAAMTLSLSVLYSFSNVQFGFSAGIDKNLDNTIDKWIFQSKPWISFGIGTSIFKNN